MNRVLIVDDHKLLRAGLRVMRRGTGVGTRSLADTYACDEVELESRRAGSCRLRRGSITPARRTPA
jgi:DNA-binding NarL/FixJ family response regulator